MLGRFIASSCAGAVTVLANLIVCVYICGPSSSCWNPGREEFAKRKPRDALLLVDGGGRTTETFSGEGNVAVSTGGLDTALLNG